MSAVLVGMMCNLDDPTMMTKACENLRRDNKADFVTMGGMPVLLRVLKKHCNNASVNQAGWETVTDLICRGVMKDVFVKEGFMPVLVAALTHYCQHLGVITVACSTAFFLKTEASFVSSKGFYHPPHPTSPHPI